MADEDDSLDAGIEMMPTSYPPAGSVLIPGAIYQASGLFKFVPVGR